MQLKHLSNFELHLKTESLASEERRLNVEVLWCLKEVESRMLFAEMGYSSLYEYATKKLLYSEGAAHRRIASMRLLKTLPEPEQHKVEQKLSSGELNITNLSLLQGSLQVAKKSGNPVELHEKLNLIKEISSRSKSETEKKLVERFPEQVLKTPVKTELGAGAVRIAIELTADEYNEIRELKALTGESDLKTLILKYIRNDLDRVRKIKMKPDRPRPNAANREASGRAVSESEVHPKPVSTMRTPKNLYSQSQQNERHLSGEVKRKVWERDGGTCTYTARDGTQCGTRFALQFDHIHPFAFGGAGKPENLRLRCPTHNRLHAVRMYGPAKMEKMMNKH